MALLAHQYSRHIIVLSHFMLKVSDDRKAFELLPSATQVLESKQHISTPLIIKHVLPIMAKRSSDLKQFAGSPHDYTVSSVASDLPMQKNNATECGIFLITFARLHASGVEVTPSSFLSEQHLQFVQEYDFELQS